MSAEVVALINVGRLAAIPVILYRLLVERPRRRPWATPVLWLAWAAFVLVGETADPDGWSAFAGCAAGISIAVAAIDLNGAYAVTRRTGRVR